MQKIKYTLMGLFSVLVTRLLIPIYSSAASGDEAKSKMFPFISSEFQSWFWVVAVGGFVIFLGGLLKMQTKQGRVAMGVGFILMVSGVSLLTMLFQSLKV